MAAHGQTHHWRKFWLLLLGLSLGNAFAQGEAGRAAAPVAVEALSLRASPGTPNLESGSVTFIGNATVLIRYAGFVVLTDPNFLRHGESANLGLGRSAKRLTDPAFALESLPPLDLIVLTQLQADHFDHVVQEKLDRATPIITNQQAASSLTDTGFIAVHPLSPWQSLTVKKGDAELRVTALPARHGKGVAAKMLPEAMGSMLEFVAPDGGIVYRIYLSGDTVISNEIKEIAQRYPEIDLAIIYLGGEKLLGTMPVTMDAKQGVEMMRILSPRKAIPVHFDDYDRFKSTLADFDKQAKIAEVQYKMVYLRRGEPYDFKAEGHSTGQ